MKNTTSKVSQKVLVRNHLAKGGKIDSSTALRAFRCTRLAAVIYTLKQDGYDINAQRVRQLDGTVLATYSLAV
jgi:hypothetical protein